MPKFAVYNSSRRFRLPIIFIFVFSFPSFIVYSMVRGSARIGGMNRFPPPLAGPLVPPFMSRRVPRHPFDIVLCEGAFPRVKPGAHTTEESAFNAVSADCRSLSSLLLLMFKTIDRCNTFFRHYLNGRKYWLLVLKIIRRCWALLLRYSLFWII